MRQVSLASTLTLTLHPQPGEPGVLRLRGG